MSTFNVPRRAQPTQGDTIADAIGQIARTLADAQLRQEYIDATQRANQARIDFETAALAQRASLASAAQTAGVQEAQRERTFETKERKAEQVFKAAEAKKERAPITPIGEAAELTDILKAGQDIFTAETIGVLEKRIQSLLSPVSVTAVPTETTFSDLDSFIAAFQSEKGRAPSQTELGRARVSGLLTDTPRTAELRGLAFPPR